MYKTRYHMNQIIHISGRLKSLNPPSKLWTFEKSGELAWKNFWRENIEKTIFGKNTRITLGEILTNLMILKTRKIMKPVAQGETNLTVTST